MFLARVVKKIKTHILCPTVIFPANRVVCETMWENMVEPDRTQVTNMVEPDRTQMTNMVEPDRTQMTNMVEPDRTQVTNMVEPDRTQMTNMVEPDRTQMTNRVEPDRTQMTNMVEPDRTQMTNNTMQENELCILSEQGTNRETHTRLIDRHCFDTTTMFTRTPLTVKLCFKYSTLPVFFFH